MLSTGLLLVFLPRYSTVAMNRQQAPPLSTVSTVSTVMCFSGSSYSRMYSTLCREHSQWAASVTVPSRASEQTHLG